MTVAVSERVAGDAASALLMLMHMVAGEVVSRRASAGLRRGGAMTPAHLCAGCSWRSLQRAVRPRAGVNHAQFAEGSPRNVARGDIASPLTDGEATGRIAEVPAFTALPADIALIMAAQGTRHGCHASAELEPFSDF